MSVVAEIKEVGPWKKQLSIAVPVAAVEAESQRVVESYRRQARVPGFRKGKMPVSMVRQQFREDIEKDILDQLIPRYWRQASAEEKLDPLLPPRVEEVDFVLDEQLTFVASVEVRPEIELGDIESFDLPETDTDPSESEVSEALDQLRKDVALWVPVERGATAGDLVEVLVTELVDGDSEEEPEAREAAIEVGDERVWAELSEAVEALTAGESASFERRDPVSEEAAGDEAEGEEESVAAAEEDQPLKRYEVQVTAVKERELPDLDDELAARLGDFGDFKALEARVSESIEESKRAEDRQAREREVLAQLRQRHPMTLPEGVVDLEIEGMLREYADGMAHQGIDVQNADIEWQKLADQIKPQAQERVQSRLILDAIAAAKEIDVEGDELEQALAQLAAAQQSDVPSLRRSMDESGQLDRLRMQLMRHKTMLILLGEGAEEETTTPESDESDEGE